MEINSYLGKEFLCGECGKKHKVAVRYIEEGDTEKLGPFLEAVFGTGKRILLLADNITWESAGKQCKNSIEDRYKVIPVVLSPAGERKVTARADYLGDIEDRVRDADVILTVGAGTLTDLGKLAGSALGKPVAAFPTAPSMNGYTSPVAAYLKDGLKLTVPVTPAVAVFVDMSVLEESPLELIKAGFADSLAKSSANADWKMSYIITGESFCSMSYKITSRSEEKYVDRGELLLKRDRRAISSLMEGLNLGGISMIIAGKSSPASGGEHMISHFLDMYSHKYRDEVFAYHGLQVGTGVFISALIYQELKNLSACAVRKMMASTRIDHHGQLKKLLSMFPESAGPLMKEFDEKIRQVAMLRKDLSEKWEELKRETFGMVYAPRETEEIFKKAEIPLHLKKIAVDEAIIYNAITLARFIRGRLTVLDIAGETGLLESFAEKYLRMN